jgi:hypothetical protein
VILVFALVFALIEAWRGATTVRPTSFGWLALALLIVVQIFYRGQEVFFK